MSEETVQQTYKDQQKPWKKRLVQLFKGPKGEQKKIFTDSAQTIWGWDKTGLKKLGFRAGGKEYKLTREPANKKERRKAAEGLPYRDKKGKVAKDDDAK